MNKIKKDENGHIVVETVGAFIPLVLLMISILSLVNIVTVQARIHYAMTQTAEKISIYSYALKAIDNPEIKSVFTGINTMADSNVINTDDTASVIEDIVNAGKDRLAGYVLDRVINQFVESYLANDNESGREFLKRFGIRNLDFGSSILIDKNENIRLTAEYEADYTFGALPLPFGPGLKITQTVITKSWQNGSGTGYGALNE